jgi:hypothetical protein
MICMGEETLMPSFSFVGRMASGKSTYADEMARKMSSELGIRIYRASLSAKISEVAKELFGMEGKDRRLLQKIGTKMREIDPEVWARLLVQNAIAFKTMPMIIDGIRTHGEEAVIREGIPGMFIVRLETREHERLAAFEAEHGRRPTEEELNDITEEGIASIREDITMSNPYRRDLMEKQIGMLVDMVREGRLSGSGSTDRTFQVWSVP